MKRFSRALRSALVMGLAGFCAATALASMAAAADIKETDVLSRLGNICDFENFARKTSDPSLRNFARKEIAGRDISTCKLSEPSWTRFRSREILGYRTRWLLDRVLWLDGADELIAAADRGDMTATALLGYAKREGRGVSKDVDRGLELLVSACAAGNPQGCIEKTYSRYWGRGVPQNVAASLVDFKDMCEQGMGSACDRAGFIISRGEGDVSKDMSLANEYYDKACKAKSGNGCTNRGHSYKNGSGGLVDKNKARLAYLKGCELFEGYACAQMWDVAVATRSDPDSPSLSSQLVYLRRGCSLGSGSSCFKVGDVYNKGRYGFPRNPDRAYQAMSQACKLGQSNGCYNQGSWLISGRGVTADSAKAIEVLRPLCEKDKPDYQACNNAGSAAYRGIGMGGPDYQLAAVFYRKACYYSAMPAACSAVIDMLEDGETQPLQANELDVLRLKMAE